MKCPKCGTELPKGASQCPGCGQQFVTGKYCPHCRAVIPSTATVCPQCKQPVGGAAPSGRRRQSSFRWWRIPIYILVFVLGVGVGVVSGQQTSKSSVPSSASAVNPSEVSSISSRSSEPVNLDGEWEQANKNSETSYQSATITGNTIEIYWIDTEGETKSLYWAGTVDVASIQGEDFSWESKNDTSKTSGALLASVDATKQFTYKNGQISYEASIMGTTMTVRLEKKADGVDTHSEPSKPSETTDSDTPKEFINALQQAETYSKVLHMSKQGIYDQLVSEYGGKFPPEAAQYAIDNLVVDYNANALATAKNYYDNMSMSKEDIRNQLTSEYGDKFTQEEADYAVSNLE